MEYTIIYKNIKHAYVRIKDWKPVITLSKKLKGNKTLLESMILKWQKLLEIYDQKQKILAIGDSGTTVFWEQISWAELGLENKTLATREKHLKKMLLEYAEELTNLYTEQLSKIVGKSYVCNSVKIKKMTAKWWYCTSRQNIVYALQLLHLPNNWIRYVIIHEVCHLREKNHSKNFRDLVEQLCPDYKKIKKWMREVSLEKDI